jgi:hypothetical protein
MSQLSKFTWINLSEFNPSSDPGTRKQICKYHPNDRQLVRRAYIAKGPYQSRERYVWYNSQWRYYAKLSKDENS